MANSPLIEIDAEPVKKLRIRLVGTEYTATPQKASLGVALARKATENADDVLALYDDMLAWVDASFSKKEAAAIRRRLDDPRDLLDITHVITLMERITEVQTGNPPT